MQYTLLDVIAENAFFCIISKSPLRPRWLWSRGHCHVRQWHLVHAKSIVGAMSSKFPFKLYLWVCKRPRGIISLLWWIKIVMAYRQIVLRKESQTVGNSPVCCSNPTLYPTYLPTQRVRFRLFECMLYKDCHIVRYIT